MPSCATGPQRSDARRNSAIVLGIGVWLVGAAGLAVADPAVVKDGVVHVANSATVAHGVQTVTLEEMWRAGGEDDEEVMFGAIGDVIGDEALNLYVLDSQLSLVSVFAPDGVFTRTLSREGDGPGEVRRPAGLTFLPDGTLGIYQRFPGKIVKIDLNDTPAGSLTPGGDPTEGGFGGIQAVHCRNGRIVCSGTKMTPGDGTMTRTNYLALLNSDGSKQVRYLERSREANFARHEFIEKDNYFVDAERWALGADGRVYAAPVRDRYRIEVYAPDGERVLVIEREFDPYRRAQQEKDDVAGGVVAMVNGQRVQLDTQIEDHDPAIASLRVDDAGYLWVRHGRSGREQPDGVMLTYDVFDPQGQLVRQVAFRCEGDAKEDKLFFPAPGRALLVKGYRQARRSMFGGGGEDNEEGADEDQPASELEIICYRITS